MQSHDCSSCDNAPSAIYSVQLELTALYNKHSGSFMLKAMMLSAKATQACGAEHSSRLGARLLAAQSKKQSQA